MINCKPNGLCSWDYLLYGDIDGLVSINLMRESGEINISGDSYSVEKEGAFSGTWFLGKNGKTIASAEKESAFTRSITISYGGDEFFLEANSMFSREMTFNGPGTSLTIAPAHSFTRRATISGTNKDPVPTAFAFWLTVILWRRTQNST
jgi:hypothetical protein